MHGKIFPYDDLILVDAQRLVDSVPFSFFVIIGPIELVLCLGLLYRLLGTAVLVWRSFFVLEYENFLSILKYVSLFFLQAGLAVLVLVTPLNLWASK